MPKNGANLGASSDSISTGASKLIESGQRVMGERCLLTGKSTGKLRTLMMLPREMPAPWTERPSRCQRLGGGEEAQGQVVWHR